MYYNSSLWCKVIRLAAVIAYNTTNWMPALIAFRIAMLIHTFLVLETAKSYLPLSSTQRAILPYLMPDLKARELITRLCTSNRIAQIHLGLFCRTFDTIVSRDADRYWSPCRVTEGSRECGLPRSMVRSKLVTTSGRKSLAAMLSNCSNHVG